jgi:hypothetical protein
VNRKVLLCRALVHRKKSHSGIAGVDVGFTQALRALIPIHNHLKAVIFDGALVVNALRA